MNLQLVLKNMEILNVWVKTLKNILHLVLHLKTILKMVNQSNTRENLLIVLDSWLLLYLI